MTEKLINQLEEEVKNLNQKMDGVWVSNARNFLVQKEVKKGTFLLNADVDVLVYGDKRAEDDWDEETVDGIAEFVVDVAVDEDGEYVSDWALSNVSFDDPFES